MPGELETVRRDFVSWHEKTGCFPFKRKNEISAIDK